MAAHGAVDVDGPARPSYYAIALKKMHVRVAGYLNAVFGDRLYIRYVGFHGDEADWFYGTNCNTDEEGWFEKGNVSRAVPPDAFDNLGSFVMAIADTPPSVNAGQWFRVESYENEENLEWVFVAHPGHPDKKCWLRRKSVMEGSKIVRMGTSSPVARVEISTAELPDGAQISREAFRNKPATPIEKAKISSVGPRDGTKTSREDCFNNVVKPAERVEISTMDIRDEPATPCYGVKFSTVELRNGSSKPATPAAGIEISTDQFPDGTQISREAFRNKPIEGAKISSVGPRDGTKTSREDGFNKVVKPAERVEISTMDIRDVRSTPATPLELRNEFSKPATPAGGVEFGISSPRSVERTRLAIRSPSVTTPAAFDGGVAAHDIHNKSTASRRTASLCTFGLETLDQELYDECESRSGGAHAKMPRPVLENAMSRVNWKPDILIDARQFPDPAACKLARHTGNNHLIIERLVDHQNFPSWLSKLKKEWLQAIDCSGNEPHLRVAFYCRAGRHRSVAASNIMRHILQKERWNCPEPVHLSKGRWFRGCKGNCTECTSYPSSLKDALAKSVQIWDAC